MATIRPLQRPLVLVVQRNQEFADRVHPIEVWVAGTTLRGIGNSVKDALDDLWTSSAQLLAEDLEEEIRRD